MAMVQAVSVACNLLYYSSLRRFKDYSFVLTINRITPYHQP